MEDQHILIGQIQVADGQPHQVAPAQTAIDGESKEQLITQWRNLIQNDLDRLHL